MCIRDRDNNLISIVSNSSFSEWEKWKDTRFGKRGAEYKEKKEFETERLIDEVKQVLGPMEVMDHLDTFTPLSVRDWVNSPDGSIYGVMRSTDQILKAAMLNRTPVKGLHLAGQNVLSPGIMGAIFGSFDTVSKIVGPERFQNEIRLKN